MVVSPLTDSSDVNFIKSIQADKLINDWQCFFHLDITNELSGQKEITCYQCNKTKLKFFLPFDVAGSGKLYEQLEKIEWYYQPQKWEHNVAIQDLDGCYKVLEVGCGRGAFLERLSKELKIDAQGIELNLSAAQYAINKGISVSQINLNKLAQEKKEEFDAVCAFQVLEHVVNPKEFLSDLINLVKPNGKLIVSVPNSDSFCKYLENDLLNQPPHHMTQWSRKTFYSLTSIFPIQINNIRLEPLAKYHTDWYASAQASRLPKIWLLPELGFWSAHYILKPLLNSSSAIRNLIQGHTLYVCFDKTS